MTEVTFALLVCGLLQVGSPALLEDFVSSVQTSAIETLARNPDVTRSAFAQSIDCLRDPDANVRRAASSAGGRASRSDKSAERPNK